MFEEAAVEVRTAVQQWRLADQPPPDARQATETIRQRCKDAIVYLESCDQPALAARVEREYERIKQAFDEPAGEVVDAADELIATLSSLERFRSKLQQQPMPPESPDFKHVRWPGWDQWENWGVALAKDGTWRLYHFQRTNFWWVRHQHSTLKIPRGVSDALARKFLRLGFVTMKDAHDVLRNHANGFVERHVLEAKVIEKTKSPMSRLRRVIRDAIRREGYVLKGMPIAAPADNAKNWRAKIKFGTLEPREGSGYRFTVHY